MFTKTFKLILLLQFLFSPLQAHAKELVSSFDLLQGEAFTRYSDGNEYMSGKEPGTVMMKVNLWGAVRKPGIHHIPVKTDLIALLSYGGGPTENAYIDEITIKRNLGNKQKIIDVDLQEILHGNQAYDLTLQPEDIIVIPARKPVINQDTYMLVTLISSLTATALTMIVLSRKN